MSAPTAFGATKFRCSAPGCDFIGDASTTATLGAGQKAFCQHHATGGELVIADLIWRLPCACGRVADGFRQVVGGFSANHTAERCIERTIQAKPDDLMVPMISPAAPLERVQIVRDQKCACGKRVDGTVNAVGSFVESHSVRECIEQTKRVE